MNNKENIYDARIDKQLYFILSENVLEEESRGQLHKTAIIAHLYYEEDVEWYLKQLSAVPNGIDVYVISPNAVIRRRAEKYGFYAIGKKNRGRDISALLVTSKVIIDKYEYVCFLHDKRKSEGCTKEDVALWIENLWLNSIASEVYIQNVLNLLHYNQELGMLVPPEPIGVNWRVWGAKLWQSDYENTKKMCEELQLNCDICENKPPITIGTVFWCKVKALKKLFDKEWKYEDFPDEPMPLGGTISHAVERVLGYVIQDAGYDVGTMLTQSYATRQMLFYHDFAGKVLGEYLPLDGIMTVQQVDSTVEAIRKTKKFFEQYKKVYLYGAGKVGKKGLQYLKEVECNPCGFLVSDVKSEEIVEGLPVFSRAEINDWSNCGIIVSVGKQFRTEVETLIKDSIKCEYILLEELMKGWMKG